MADGFGEGGQIKIGIVLMADVIVGHIGMTKTVHSYLMRQTDAKHNIISPSGDASLKNELHDGIIHLDKLEFGGQ